MTELTDRDYGLEAWFTNLTNLVYAEIHRQKLSDRYRGICISVVAKSERTVRRDAEQIWKDRGIKQGPHKLAREVVTLATCQIGGRPELTGLLGRKLLVTEQGSPALSALSLNVVCSPCQEKDWRRSDGVAAPLVIFSGGWILPEAEELLVHVNKTIRRKIQGRSSPGWGDIDNAVLLLHDLPREQFYMGWHNEGLRELLVRSIDETQTRDSFDEVFWCSYATGRWTIELL